MDDHVKILKDLLLRCPFTQTINRTAVPYLFVCKFSEKIIPLPSATPHYIFYVADGSVRFHTPNGILDYVAGQYSISTVDMPFDGQAVEQTNGSILALVANFTADEIFSVLLSFRGNLAETIANESLPVSFMEQADKNVTDCFIRLISLLDDETSLDFMADHIKREIIFHILCGSCGSRFLQSIAGAKQNSEIYDINSWIKQNFRQPFRVEELAKQNNMSISALHQKFKRTIGMGILQCQKRLRLSEARRLMLNDDLSVTNAAFEVGYESVSQFIRDYKKMFGFPPKDDIRHLRNKFAETGKKRIETDK